MTSSESLIEKVESLQNMLIACATGGSGVVEEYARLRRELLNEVSINDRLPRFVKTCRDLTQFWNFIKYKFAHYQERRDYLWAEFRPILDSLENQSATPADHSISENLEQFDAEHVHQVWLKALARRAEDPEAAITSARTLLESVCKHILDETGTAYEDNADLPKLYHLTSIQLNLAPDQHSEQIFKQILGSCQSIVGGLGAVRNRYGDAHGQGSSPTKPSPRHAELAVNLAGAMSTFLVATWESRTG